MGFLKTAAAATAVLLGASLPVLLAVPAHAAGSITVANASGQAVADPDYSMTVTVSGRGYQSIKGGRGGIYVAFGTVSSGWQPTKGGITGKDYFYVPDSESGKNNGFQKFVAFPGSSTSGEANGGVIAADGTWSTTLSIPGSSFQATDRNGAATTIDCLKVQCGVLTLGAHGLKNAHNEAFTPVRFAKGTATASPGTDGGTGTDGTDATEGTEGTDGTAGSNGSSGETGQSGTGTPAVPGGTQQPVTGPKGKPRLSIDRSSAKAGAALSFTGAGMTPGRQVTVVLDDGAAAAGPFLVGADGTFAGVLQVPATAGGGTHELRVFGIKKAPTLSFALAASEATDAAASATQDQTREVSATDTTEGRLAIGAVVLAGALVLAALVRLGIGLSSRRRRA